MGKTWNTRRRGDEQDFLRSLRKGKTVYTIDTPEHAGAARLWNHAQTYSAHTVTGRHPILGGWIFDGSPSNSAKSLFQWAGTVYEDQPRDIPHKSDHYSSDVRIEGYGPHHTWEKETRKLNSAEYRALNTREAEAKDRYDEDRKAGRRGGKWF